MESIVDYIRQLETSGRHSFTVKQAVNETGSNLVAIRASLRRLTSKGHIASPSRGFYLIVPPRYSRLGCLPPEQFIPDLMKSRNLGYYVGLLSAASYMSATQQRSQEFQVVVPRSLRPIQCGSVKVSFIMKKHMAEVATVIRNTPRGFLYVSSPETTAYDLVGYIRRCGGLENVILTLHEIFGHLDGNRLAQSFSIHPIVWAQRLGYLLEYSGADTSLTEPLARIVATSVRDYTKLIPGIKSENSERNKRWKLMLNAALGAVE